MNNAEKLRSLRLKKGMKKTDVASALQISYQSYLRYENGERELPFKVILLASQLFNVPVNYFGDYSDIIGIGNNGYTIKNTKTSEVLEVTAEEFEMLKGVLTAFRSK